jgi:hypothetical protein
MDLLDNLTTAILAWQSVVYTPTYLKVLRGTETRPGPQPYFEPEDAAQLANDVLVEMQGVFKPVQIADWVEAFIAGERETVCSRLLRDHDTPVVNDPVRRIFGSGRSTACRRLFDFRALTAFNIREAKGARGPRNNWVNCMPSTDPRRPMHAVVQRFRVLHAG